MSLLQFRATFIVARRVKFHAHVLNRPSANPFLNHHCILFQTNSQFAHVGLEKPHNYIRKHVLKTLQFCDGLTQPFTVTDILTPPAHNYKSRFLHKDMCSLVSTHTIFCSKNDFVVLHFRNNVVEFFAKRAALSGFSWELTRTYWFLKQCRNELLLFSWYFLSSHRPLCRSHCVHPVLVSLGMPEHFLQA